MKTLAQICLPLVLFAFAGCKNAGDWRADADRTAAAYLGAAQKDVTGRVETFEIETPADTLRRRLLLDQGLVISDLASLGVRDLPADRYWTPGDRLLPGTAGGAAGFAPGGTNALEIGLADAVRIAAANSRDFQAKKEALYTAALGLDLANKTFRSTLKGVLSGGVNSSRGDGADGRETSHGEKAGPSVSRRFENGAELTGSIAANLAGMLSGDRATAWGCIADVSISIPLLRGSGELVNRESLTQAERDLIYAVRSFEQDKRAFAVDVESAYLSLLLALRTRQNEDDNYRRIALSTRRSRRMADASRMSKSEFDQSYQSELSARASWTAACQSYEAALESFKMRLGLPPDALVRPREADLDELRDFAEKFRPENMDGTEELPPPSAADWEKLADEAIRRAFSNRLDFATHRDRIEDAQRRVLIAEDALRAEVTIGASASAGSAASPSMGRDGIGHAPFKPKNSALSGALTVDLPFERTGERNAYRASLIALEQAVRAYQEQEDGLKRTIRADVRDLMQTEENLRIQFRAVELARRRVRNQDLLLESGRTTMTDVLDAQAALVGAQNKLYSAITKYRENELRLRCDTGELDVTVDGVWRDAEAADRRSGPR